MATTNKNLSESVELVIISTPETRVSEVQNVAGAYLWDESEGTYTDYTAEANSDAVGDVPLIPGSSTQYDGFVIGAAVPFDWACFKINTAGTGAYEIALKYWDGVQWALLYEGYPAGSYDVYYNTVGSFKAVGYGRTLLASQPGGWTPFTIDGKYCYWLKYSLGSIGVTVSPIADRIWLGTWSVAHTVAWSDTMQITDTNMLAMQTNKVFSDNMAIDDTQVGQWVTVWDIVRSWSDIMDISDLGGLVWNWLERNIYFNDIMTITDLTDTQGMQFQISVNFADVMTIADLLNIAQQYAVSWLDIMSIADTLSFGSGLVVSDLMDITDQGLTFNIGLNLSDLMEIIDQGWAGLDWARAFQDVMTITDSILWRGDYPAPVYLRFSARRPQITIYTKAVKKQ